VNNKIIVFRDMSNGFEAGRPILIYNFTGCLSKEGAEKNIWSNIFGGILEEQNERGSEAIIWRNGHSNRNRETKIEMAGTCGEDE
jgi:hypothetical protein